MKRNVFVVGMAVMVLTFGLLLAGCASADPAPIGDSQNPRDELAGKTYAYSEPPSKITLIFNYDGTVTSKKVLGIITKVDKPTSYSWDGTIGIIPERVGQDSKFTLNSTRTEMTMNGNMKFYLKK